MNQKESLENIMDEKRKDIVHEGENTSEEEVSNGEPLHLDQNSFYDLVENSEKPVFVDFWAPWCAPCKMVAPIVEDLAEEFEGEVVVGKLNLEEGNNRRVAQQYRVSGVPTFIIFKEGEPVERMVGARKKAAFEDTIEKYL